MKHIFMLLFILSFLSLHAQTEKKYLIKANVGYNYTHSDQADIPAYLSYEGINKSNLKISISAAKKINPVFSLGFGLSYETLVQKYSGQSYPLYRGPVLIVSDSIIRYDTIPLNDMPVFASEDIARHHIFSPFVFSEYNLQLGERFFFIADMFVRFSFDKIVTEHGPHLDPEISYRKEETKQFFTAGIYPSIRFRLFKNIGLDFTFGSVIYNAKTMDSRVQQLDHKTKEFNISFQPENWFLGFWIEL